MKTNRSGSFLLSTLLITGLLVGLLPALPALAWTDRPAATTEDPGHAWTVVFDDPMNTATMNSQNIYVSTDQNGSSRVDGAEASAADSTHAVVAPPAGGWVIGTTYYLIVTQNVLTGEGMPLEDAVRMQFTVQTPGQKPPTLTDSGIKVYLEDQPLAFTVPPQTMGGRVMVPMRPIFEAMGASLDWEPTTQTATAVKGATTVITQIGNNSATINGVAQTLDVPPTAINGSTLAPLRFVAEAFGYHVKWDGASQTAYISGTPFTDVSQVSTVNVGDIIEFGHYEQDNNLSNGPEKISWRVLAVENNKALLLSEKGLDAKPYNENRVDVTWETCTLRKWLNNEFYKTAFSSSEQSSVATSILQNVDSLSYGTEGGNDTWDHIFCLSIDEAQRYFPADSYSNDFRQEYNPERCMKVTAYAESQGAYVDKYSGWSMSNGNSGWWLRSPGTSGDTPANVDTDGSIYEGGAYVTDDGHAVRPALWMNL